MGDEWEVKGKVQGGQVRGREGRFIILFFAYLCSTLSMAKLAPQRVCPVWLSEIAVHLS